ncbi:MAG: hypothetical protein ACO3UU_06920 [Minisyncoccia bacterium]
MNTTTIKHKYNIGDKHFDFNREIDREHKKAIDKFNEAYDSKIYNLLEHMLTKI